MKKLTFYIVLLALLMPALSLHAAGRDAFQFLLLTPGARSAALGESGAGVAEGAESVIANPSSLARETRRQISFQHLLFVEGIRYHNLFYLQPIAKGVGALHIGYLGVGGIAKTVADTAVPDGFRETGDFSVTSMLLGLSFARKVSKNFSVGANARLVREALDDTAGSGPSIDLGFLYSEEELPVQFGFAFQHLGPAIKFKDDSFQLPRLLRGGLSWKKPRDSQKRWIPDNSLITAEILRLFNEGEYFLRSGVELPFFEELIFMRLGYHRSFKSARLGSANFLPNGLTFGLGLRGRSNSWQTDYAADSIGDLGLAHRISLSVRFGAEVNE